MEQCARIVSHKIIILSKIRKSISEDTALYIYRSMIAPILDYGDIIYAGGLSGSLDKMQKLENRALRVCLDVHHYLPVIVLHQEADIPNLIVRRSCNIKKYMYKQQNDDSLLVKPNIMTRLHKGNIFKTQKPCLETFKKNLLYNGALTWYSLPAEVRNLPTYDRGGWVGSSLLYISIGYYMQKGGGWVQIACTNYLKNWSRDMNQNIRV